MTAFYTVLLAWTRIDLRIARSTGCNPAHVAQLINDERKWELALWQTRWRIQQRYGK